MSVEVAQRSYTIDTHGRGTYEITDKIPKVIATTTIVRGLAHIFVHHTSASLMLCENADPAVRRDLETFMADIAPDGDSRFEHISEGPDDMPAHIRTMLTTTGLNIPIIGGHCALGTWQGVYLWEHRTQPHQRKITITIQGYAETL
ncbi:MAG: YjbQ family protein [Thiothrix sp.]|nr:MAG: YjbQ family protein [Thiothrix sp.]